MRLCAHGPHLEVDCWVCSPWTAGVIGQGRSPPPLHGASSPSAHPRWGALRASSWRGATGEVVLEQRCLPHPSVPLPFLEPLLLVVLQDGLPARSALKCRSGWGVPGGHCCPCASPGVLRVEGVGLGPVAPCVSSSYPRGPLPPLHGLAASLPCCVDGVGVTGGPSGLR